MLPTPLIAAYLSALAIFAVLDIAWISMVVAPLYREILGDVLAPSVRIAPAIAFYLLYPAGLVIFAIAPALKSGRAVHALVYGGLFGLFTYGTYDLTNYATLRNWTLGITVSDIAYGAAMSAFVAVLTFAIVRRR